MSEEDLVDVQILKVLFLYCDMAMLIIVTLVIVPQAGIQSGNNNVAVVTW